MLQEYDRQQKHLLIHFEVLVIFLVWLRPVLQLLLPPQLPLSFWSPQLLLEPFRLEWVLPQPQYQINILQILNILLINLPALTFYFIIFSLYNLDNIYSMISTPRRLIALTQSLKYQSSSYTNGNPYNVRWQYQWKPAYYTYPKQNYEPTRVGKPEDFPSVRPPFYSYFQDFLLRIFPSLKTIYKRSSRYQDNFQIFVLPSLSLLAYQFWDIAFGFKVFTILPMIFFWVRIRDKTIDPEIDEVHLRDFIHNNPELGKLFTPETIHLLDYQIEWDEGFPCQKKFPQFKNKFFRFFNNDTHMTSGFIKFGDLESGATMNLKVKTMPTHGQFRYQVGEPYYFYDLRAEVTHNGTFKEIVLVDENTELLRKRPFLLIL